MKKFTWEQWRLMGYTHVGSDDYLILRYNDIEIYRLDTNKNTFFYDDIVNYYRMHYNVRQRKIKWNKV